MGYYNYAQIERKYPGLEPEANRFSFFKANYSESGEISVEELKREDNPLHDSRLYGLVDVDEL